MSAVKDLAGQRFGRLTVTARDGRSNDGKATWLCRCDCGKDVVTLGKSLRDGKTRSCGCLHRETMPHGTSHGHAGRRSPEYRSWTSMHQRCRSDPFYVGSGITVCERWSSFEAFLADMGPQPQTGERYTIDRIDNAPVYGPGTTRWATYKTQERNKTNNRLITYAGQTMTLADWSEHTGIHRQTISNRIARGWPLDRALTCPPGGAR